MADQRLLKALHGITAEEAERLFGDQGSLEPPNSDGVLAPVKRVAIFAESFLPKVDGVSRTAILTLRYLQRTGREVLVFAPDFAPQSVGMSRVVPLPSVAWYKAPESRMALPHPMIISQHLNNFQPDLIHLFSPALLSLGGTIIGRQNHIPVIANYQTDLPSYANHYNLALFSQALNDTLRYLHNQCHLTLVPSNWTAQQLQQTGYHRLRKWGRGVNHQHFNPAKRSAEWRMRLLNGRDPNSLLCIYVGRLANEKRVDLLLEVARTPGVALTIIGDGALRGELETMFAGTNTPFSGYLYGEDLAHAYASADAFMFTGACETFGQVVQEAMSSGLPCVVMNQGGVTDLVTDDVNGFTCPPDAAAFAASAVILRDDLALRQRMAATSRALAECNPWESVLGQLETHYSEAIELNERMGSVLSPNLGLLGKIIQLGGTPARKMDERVS